MDLPKKATATIATERAERFAKQFISHWGRETKVESDGSSTIMKFDAVGDWPATAVRVETRTTELIITAWAEDAAGLEKNCASIAEHLHRFAGRREVLTIDWLD